jgi:uncharacterized protein (TIGR02001 family)
VTARAPERPKVRRPSDTDASLAAVRVLVAALTTLPLFIATQVAAQVGASVSLASNSIYRGLSLSDGRPTLSLAVFYDNAGGPYAGASVTAEDTAHAGAELVGEVEYLGYAHRSRTGPSWDVGATNLRVSEYLDERYTADLTQFYAGLQMKGVNCYVYYSPSYFGQGVSTIYLDLNGGLRLAPRWRLFGHVGALQPLTGQGGPTVPREQVDLSAGVATELRAAKLELAWTAARPNVDYVAGHRQRHNALVLAATYSF